MAATSSRLWYYTKGGRISLTTLSQIESDSSPLNSALSQWRIQDFEKRGFVLFGVRRAAKIFA